MQSDPPQNGIEDIEVVVSAESIDFGQDGVEHFRILPFVDMPVRCSCLKSAMTSRLTRPGLLTVVLFDLILDAAVHVLGDHEPITFDFPIV